MYQYIMTQSHILDFWKVQYNSLSPMFVSSIRTVSAQCRIFFATLLLFQTDSSTALLRSPPPPFSSSPQINNTPNPAQTIPAPTNVQNGIDCPRNRESTSATRPIAKRLATDAVMGPRRPIRHCFWVVKQNSKAGEMI